MKVDVAYLASDLLEGRESGVRGEHRIGKHQGEGMRLDGIIEGRPAQNAGLERGDIIIQIGDVEVKDIYDYMEGLSKHKASDTVKVKVLRGKKKVEKNVTFLGGGYSFSMFLNTV